jgi:hypothetical protein
MNVLQTNTLVFDDLERWAEVSQRKPLEFTKLDTAAAQDKQVVLDRLDSVRFAPSFGTPDGGGSPLADVAGFLQSLTGVNFMLSPKVVSELDEEQKSIKLQLPERSVRKVLDIITETHDNLRWKVEDGVVKFVTKDELKGGQVLATYEGPRPDPPDPGLPLARDERRALGRRAARRGERRPERERTVRSHGRIATNASSETTSGARDRGTAIR